ncbi:hypothetical protein KDD30_15960 [Photobacterium sp. GJ3]|uniref:hypothetical protein n=1 Tax=Photobacterium sp. GJ3 TaxID=2829502 RepID=UPI001B8B557F|nr:hypothetical protein [Photobacterium sp. GJ3]QUJ67497.1 hypothetical protein KDD30_15960 [Photobacterium sp. GJ3]
MTDRTIVYYKSIKELESIDLIFDTLYIIAEEGQCTAYDILQLSRKLDKSIGYKFIESCSKFIISDPSYSANEDNLVIDRLSNRKVTSENFKYVSEEKKLSEIETLELFKRNYNLIAITSHGRVDATYLPNVVLCSKSSCFDSNEELTLSCENSSQCYYAPRTVLNSSSINSEVLFLNTCNSINSHGTGFNTAIDFSRNTKCRAFIGSPVVHNSTEYQTLIFVNSFINGNPIYKALDDTEFSLRSHEQRSMLIVGDPLTRISNPPKLVEHLNKNEDILIKLGKLEERVSRGLQTLVETKSVAGISISTIKNDVYEMSRYIDEIKNLKKQALSCIRDDLDYTLFNIQSLFEKRVRKIQNEMVDKLIKKSSKGVVSINENMFHSFKLTHSFDDICNECSSSVNKVVYENNRVFSYCGNCSLQNENSNEHSSFSTNISVNREELTANISNLKENSLVVVLLSDVGRFGVRNHFVKSDIVSNKVCLSLPIDKKLPRHPYWLKTFVLVDLSVCIETKTMNIT